MQEERNRIDGEDKGDFQTGGRYPKRSIRRGGQILAVGSEVRATRFSRYAKWLQRERRLVADAVGFGCEIHKTKCIS